MPPGQQQQQQHDGFVASCIAHLTANAEKYFDVVSEKDTDGILWAVFTCEPLRARSDVSLKRASFLPLSQVMSTKAQSLIQMYHACNLATQFVCWFTLENGRGEPLVSKVMVVDAPRGGSEARRTRGSEPLQNAMAAMRNNSSDSAVLEHLKADMLHFQEAEERATVRVGGEGQRSTPQAPASSRGASSALGTAHTPASSSTGQKRPPTAAASSKGEAVQRESDFRSTADAASQYQHILRVSLQIADSVSRMGTALDELTRRVEIVENDLSSRPQPPAPELVATLLSRIEALEQKNAALENRVGAFDTFQENIFTQFQQFKEQFRIPNFSSDAGNGTRGATSSVLGRSGADDASSGSLSGSLLFRSSKPSHHSAIDTPTRSRTLLGAAPAAEEGASPPQQQHGLPSASTPAGSFSASHAPHTTSTTATPRSVSAVDSASAAAGGAAGSVGEPSLSDMIRSMEVKLSRIRAPPSKPL